MFGSVRLGSKAKTWPSAAKWTLANAKVARALLLLLLAVFGAGRAAAQTFTGIVPVANPPVGIAINASQNAIYVTTGDNTLTVVDGSTNLATVISDPAAANTSGASALLTYQNGVFVLNKNSNNISLYFALDSGQMQPSPLQQLISEPNTKQPTAIVLDPINFGRIFVANAGSNSVSIFDNTAGNGYQLTASLTGIVNPQAMVMNTNTHQVFVTSGTNNSLTVIDGTQNAVRSTIQLPFAPKSLAFNTATNQVYVAGPGTQSIVDIDANTLATSSISIPNGIPTAIAVNPSTNQVFVANLTGVVTVIDGSNNTVQGSANVQVGNSPAGQAAIVVDATTNIAYVVIQGGGLSSVNGVTRAVTNVSTGMNGSAVLAVNPITHKSYIDSGSSTVIVVDDATNVAGNVAPSQVQPWAVAVNPTTNKIYVANFGSNNVSVIDGATNTLITEVATDSNPNAIAVDPIKNLIFVTNFNSSSATVIDGNTNQGTSVNLFNANPDSIAVNPVFGRVYGASSTQNVIFGFESNSTGSNLNYYTSFSTGPIAVAVNTATGQNYELDSSGTLEAADGPAPSRGITFVCSGGTPKAMDVNPVTNTVYVACSTGNLDVVQNPSGFSNATVNTFSNTGSVNPVGVAVNPLTNQVFIANAGTGNDDAGLTIFDVASGNSTVLGLNNTPVALAVNVASNKIYVQGQTSATTSSILVVDGASQESIASIPGFTVGALTNQVAVNPTTGAIFAVNRSNGNAAGSVTTVLENATQSDKITTTITPFSGNTTTSVTPTFTFNVTDTLDGGTAYTVYYQVDSQQKFWGYGSNTSGQTFSGTVQQPLTPGYHTVYAFAVTGGETAGVSSNNGVGFQSNQIVGSLGSYSFLVSPPIANGTFFVPFDFGSQASGTQSAAQQPLLANEGGAPMNFTVAITGPNAADFQQVAYTGTDTLCNTLSGSLPSGAYCAVNVAFHPSTTGPETATLTFTDNSLGVAGSTQSVTLTGTGTAAAQEPLSVAFTGSGKVTDNLSQLNCTASPCTQNYPVNQVVILTATPNTGFTFTGWSGACSGLGTCTVTMSQAQSVSAKFVNNGAATCGANDAIWIGGASGNWSLATNWSTGVVPNGGTAVCINNNHTPASSVTLDISVSIGNLTINPGNSLTIPNNIQLFASGTIANSGLITLVSAANNTILTLSGAVTITGGGTITLNQTGGGQPILNNANAGSLLNVNNLIQGAGQIGNNGLIVTNLAGGTFNANAAGSLPLGLNSNGVTNLGVLEASGNGVLQISTTVINKSGTITAASSTLHVQMLNGSSIQGGTVSSTSGGTLGTSSIIPPF